MRELDDIRTDTVAIANEPTNRFSQDHALLAKMKATLNDIRADVKEHGHLTKLHGDIDQHRKTPRGREELNAKRRLDYAERAMNEGREVRRLTKAATLDHKRAQSAETSAKHRANRTMEEKTAIKAADAARKRAKRDSRTPQEIEAENQRRRDQRMNKKIKLLPKPIGYGDF